jgi:serine/threonine-protein kinase RsbW
MESRKRATVSLEMPSRLEMLEKADVMVGDLAEAVGFDQDSRLAIQTAVRESLVNAIVHGNAGQAARRVTLEIDVECDGLRMRVRDEGRGFDPTCLPDSSALENLYRPSGRGILLMKALMDSVAFRRRPSGGMEVTMRKRLERAVESGSARTPADAVYC